MPRQRTFLIREDHLLCVDSSKLLFFRNLVLAQRAQERSHRGTGMEAGAWNSAAQTPPTVAVWRLLVQSAPCATRGKAPEFPECRHAFGIHSQRLSGFKFRLVRNRGIIDLSSWERSFFSCTWVCLLCLLLPPVRPPENLLESWGVPHRAASDLPTGELKQRASACGSPALHRHLHPWRRSD